MILSDNEILQAIAAKELTVHPEPDLDTQLQPASLDLRLANSFYTYKLGRPYGEHIIDVRERGVDDFMCHIVLEEGERFVLGCNEFALASTVERLTLGPQVVGRVDGRSSYGRLGVTVHSTAGFIDPGFSGQVTLELSNVGRFPVALHPGDRVCQVSFHRMGSPSVRPYGHKSRNSKYQGQTGATISRLQKDLEK